MAIIIPSKYISSIKNPKVRNNYIDNVEVNYTVISSDDNFEEVVYGQTFNDNLVGNNYHASDFHSVFYSSYGSSYNISSYLYGEESWADLSVSIKKEQKNSWISKVYRGIRTIDDGVSKTKTNWIGSTVKIKRIISDATIEVTNVIYDNKYNIYSYNLGEVKTKNPRETTSSQESIPFCNKSNAVRRENAVVDEKTAIAKIELSNLSNISTVEVSEDDENYYIRNIRILSYSKSVPLKFISTNSQPTSFTMSGKQTEYVVEEISLTFYGNTIGIDLKDGTVTVGSGDLPFSTTSNELIHTGATTYGENITSYIGEKILNQYRDGKETCTVKCSISDYYTESGELAISPHKGEMPMTFSIGDEVIPMVYTVDKTDRAISKYNNGMDKVFVVVGVKPSYTGACWQELALLEKTE